MKNFTKKQRNKIYRAVLENLMTKHIFFPIFLCNELKKKTEYRVDVFKFFPEFYLFRPNKNMHEVWFSYPDFDVLETSEIRVFVLQILIEMTK